MVGALELLKRLNLGNILKFDPKGGIDGLSVGETVSCQKCCSQGFWLSAKRKELFTEMDTMAERRAIKVSESNATGVFCRIRRD